MVLWDIIFCGHCGAQNPDQNRFCVEYGSRLKVPLDETGMAITDKISARLAGFDDLPEPTVEWPDDLPCEVTGKNGSKMVLIPRGSSRWERRNKRKMNDPTDSFISTAFT